MLTTSAAEVPMTPDKSVVWEKYPHAHGDSLLIDPSLDADTEAAVLKALDDAEAIMSTERPFEQGSTSKVYRAGDFALKLVHTSLQHVPLITGLQAGIAAGRIINDAQLTIGAHATAIRAVMPMGAIDGVFGMPSKMVIAMPFVKGRPLSFDHADDVNIFQGAGLSMRQALKDADMSQHIFLDPSTRNLLRTAPESEHPTGEIMKIDTTAFPSFKELMEQA